MSAPFAPQSDQAQPVSKSIAFIDTSIQDYQSIAGAIAAGTEIVLIDGQDDGLAQIAAVLAGRTDIDAVHIFSHGSDGQVNLGTAHLNVDTVGAHADALATIGGALAADADILLYGCDVGAGPRGAALLDALAMATGADVAASTDLTGAAALGGDWVLERSTGTIEAGSPFGIGAPAFDAVLASVYFDGSEPGYYAQQSISKQVDNVAFSFGMNDSNMVIGYDMADVSATGLYAYASGDDDVELVISVADGYSFDLGSLQVYADTPDAADENREITITITRADTTTTSFVYTLAQDYTLTTMSNFSTPIDNVTKVVLSSNHYAIFNNFEITDVKPIGPADTTAPVITGITIPDQPMKIGSVVTATIKVAADADTYTLAPGSTIGGYALANLHKVDDSTWTATFTITEGSADVAAGADIPVNVVLRDSASNASTAYTAPIAQAHDAIDANRPAPATVSLGVAYDSGWSGTDGYTSVAQPTLTGTAEAGSMVTLNIDGVDVTSTIQADASGNWEYKPAALGEATHVIKALAADAAGNQGVYGNPITVTVDTVAPTSASATVVFAADTGSSASDLVTNVAAQTISGTLSAPLGAHERVRVSLDNGAHWNDATATAGTAGWSLAGQTLAGSNTMLVQVIDEAGNQGPAVGYGYVLDTTASATTIGTIAISADSGSSATDFLTSVAAQTVTAVLSAALDNGDVLYASTGGGAWTDITASVSGTTISWDTTLKAGANAIAFKIVDRAGNEAQPFTRNYVLDTAAPTIVPTTIALSDDTGASSADLVTNKAAQTLGGTLSADLADGDVVQVSLDNGHSWAPARSDGPRAWSLPDQTLAGSGTLQVRVVDAAGNAGAIASHAYTLDTTPPATTVGAIAISADGGTSATDFTTGIAAQTVTATLSAGLAAGESLSASADGGVHWTDITAMVDGTSVTWNDVTLKAGASALQFKVVDLAGNEGAIASQPYTLDTVAPVARAAIVAFSDDSGESDSDLVTNGAAQTLSGTLDRASDAGDRVRISLDNGAHWTWAQHAAGSAAWSLDGQVLAQSDTLLVQVVDAAGNAGPAVAKAYVFDTGAPSASVASVAIGAGTDVTGARSSETGTVYLVKASLEITSIADLAAAVQAGAATRASVTAAATDTTVATTGLAAGSYHLVAVDKAGNVGAPSSNTVTLLAAPNAVAATVKFSSDSGASDSDFITRIAAQDISGTLSAPTIEGERVEVSFDGQHWLTASHVAGTTAWTLDGQVLSGSGTLQVRVSNAVASGTVLRQDYVLDTVSPVAPGAPLLAPGSDSGTAGDGITSVNTPVLSGHAEALAQVTLYDSDGSTVIGTVRADATGAWHVATTLLADGAHTITVRQTDVAGNVSAAGAPLALTIDTTTLPPAQPPEPSQPTLIDGMPVQVAPVTLPGGVAGTSVSVPIVTTDRSETSGAGGVADIPLATSGAGNLLLAQLAPGYGLSSSGANVGVASGLEFLIASIKAATPNHAADDQGHLTGNGQTFLGGLASTGSLLVQTVKPVSAGAVDGMLTLSGQAASAGAGQSVALVIDAGGLGAGSTIVLKQVDFGAVIGSANVVATGNKLVLSGDAAGQHFTVGTVDASSVFAGGGNDTLSFGAPSAVTAGVDPASGQARAMAVPATTLLHGGQQSDTAVFAGVRADYNVEQHNGYLLVSSKAAPEARALVVNVEQLQFDDGSVAVQDSVDMDILAGMYRTVLGRQADMGGIEFWADGRQSGTGWGRTVLDFIDSTEYTAQHASFNGVAEHDLTVLYSALFNRAPDAEGLAFWMAAMANGASFEHVAGEFVQSVEMTGHQRAALEWDFIV